MGLIKKPNELNVQTKIKMLIFGQAGMGKTTLALSAPNPLLVDFDNGVNRVNYAHIKDTVQIEKYEDILVLLSQEDLTPYDTLVIDTGGKMLDAMTSYIIRQNPKMGRANGMLTQVGYGQRKAEFSNLLRLIEDKKKDVVFVAHRQTTMDGEETRYIPQFGGSNYDALVTELDLVGYLEAYGNKRTITFEPTSRNEGKNTCNLPASMDVPYLKNEKREIAGENDFLEKEVFKRYIDRLKERSVEGEAYKKLVEEIEKEINAISTPEEATSYIKKVENYQHIGNSKAVARNKFIAKVAELGYKYDNSTKSYSAPAEEKKQEEKAPAETEGKKKSTKAKASDETEKNGGSNNAEQPANSAE